MLYPDQIPRLGLFLLLLLAGISLLLFLRPSVAGGQETPELTPPSLTHFVEAVVDASLLTDGEVAVVLELDIDAAGEVTEVRVVEGAGEPFDEAAAGAARSFRFAPARRGRTPIAARIRFRYVFSPPTARPPPPDGQPEDAAAPAAPPGEEVAPTAPGHTATPDLAVPEDPGFGATAEVRTPAREVLRHDVDREEVGRLAGAHGDPLRAVELLPGVSTTASSTDVIVRGSHPLDTQVMLEGAPVLAFNHVGGYTSFFNARLLDRVALYPSNYSVRYGRALGAIIEVTVRDRFRDGVHGGLAVNLLDAWGYVEGGSPVVEGAVAVRRSWIDAIYGAVFGDEAVTQAPVYADYQGILRYRPNERDTLRLLVYGSYDEIGLDFEDPAGDPQIQGRLFNRTQFHRGQLEWRHRYGPRVRHDLRVMAGYLGYDQQLGRLLRGQDEGLEVGSRGELHAVLAPWASLTVGYDLWSHDANASYTGPPAPPPEGDPTGFGFDEPQVQSAGRFLYVRSAVYVEGTITPVEGWSLVPGIRLDYIGDVQVLSPEPRLSTRAQVTDTTLLRAGVGLFAQPPQLGRTIEGFGNPDLGPERAVHSTVGVQQDIGGVLRVSLDAYHKHFFDRIVATPDGDAPYLVNDGIGRAYGAELAARWIGDRRFTGSLAYALSRSERRDRDGAWRPFDFDQRHVLTTALAYDLGDGWEVGATLRLLSGTPYTPVTGSVYDATTDRFLPRYGDINTARNPVWYRLDLRVAKTWRFGMHGRLQLSLDVLNATNHAAQDGRRYTFDYRDDLPANGFPIIPNLGIRGDL